MSLNTTICEQPPADRYSAKRTRHLVNLYCCAPNAQSVSLVGDFNGWDIAATPMRRMSDNRWMASMELTHGHHRYLFLVDGNPTLDPNANGTTLIDCNDRVSLIAVS